MSNMFYTKDGGKNSYISWKLQCWWKFSHELCESYNHIHTKLQKLTILISKSIERNKPHLIILFFFFFFVEEMPSNCHIAFEVPLLTKIPDKCFYIHWSMVITIFSEKTIIYLKYGFYFFIFMVMNLFEE